MHLNYLRKKLKLNNSSSKFLSYQSLTTQFSFYPVSNVNLEDYQSVTRFLDLIPQDTLAVASFRSKAYTRAVMHFESFITEKKQNIQKHLGFLQV